MAYPRFLRARSHKFVAWGGSSALTSLNATSKTAPATPTLDLTLKASVGDVIESVLDFIWDNDTTAGQGIWDVATMNGSTVLNWFGAGGTGFGGMGGTYSYGATTAGRLPAHGVSRRILTAGDIISGAVTVRPFYVVISGTKNVMWGTANFYHGLTNLGPVAPH